MDDLMMLLCGLLFVLIMILIAILLVVIKGQKSSHGNMFEKRLEATLVQQNQQNQLMMQSLMERFGKMDQSQSHLLQVSQSLMSLQQLLNDKKSRGTFGELQLASALKNLFGENKSLYQLQYRLKNGCIVDCAILGMQDEHILPIDAKFPLENFNRIFDSSSNSHEVMMANKAFKKDVMKHLNDIHDKYIVDGETTPIAFMFVPSEAIVSYLYGEMEEIISYSYQKGVFIVSITTLIAYIQVVQSLYLDQKRNHKVTEIQQEYQRLAVEFIRFKERYELILKDFDKLSSDIRNTDITMRKLVQRFERIQEVNLDEE